MNNQTVIAKLRGLRIAPRKMRFVADVIRNMPVKVAEAQLMYSSRRPAVNLLKLLRSAMANAKNNHQLDVAKLYIKEIRVDEGVKLKRWMPRARGSVAEIQKKTCHVSLILGTSDKLKIPKFTIAEVKKNKKLAPTKKKARASAETSADKDKIKENKPDVEKKITPTKEKLGTFQKVFRRKSI